ncbi:carbohydrate ABC transporter membrane protein 1 (CUT1 family) [Promicromonospora sp. AC04]|uniref:carbohydrate ABC transporter permease n=1 Tax=Promicromonospora sp. AC04 TaxID=2135723 RepID=UPI000D396EF7|nr:sugar ABC transporter permease [Promicromonospora sp. AC04]PUB32174.1 carbohydrate ABC transporter membrane protein 1 (CUT1 family) [Promicromonospora sp. AC04]
MSQETPVAAVPAPAPPPGPTLTPRRRSGLRRPGQTVAPLLFISVAVVLFVVFFVGPGSLGLYYSFTDYTGVGDPEFTGLANYQELFGDEQFYSSIGRTVLYTVLAVPAHYVAALGLSLLLVSAAARFRTAARIIFFLPWLISPIVTGVIWRWMFGENFGLVNYVMTVLSLPRQQWETNGDLALAVVILASTWAGTAFNMLLFIAALRNIPRSYLEAAQVDGASAAQRFFRITLPLLRPTSFMVILLGTLGAMKEFAMVQALNGGGPGTENMFIVQYIYQTGFERAQIGYASAVSMVLMVILIVIALVQMRFDRKDDLA